jgi:hypothetical protein
VKSFAEDAGGFSFFAPSLYKGEALYLIAEKKRMQPLIPPKKKRGKG